jgi:hypothetical protein
MGGAALENVQVTLRSNSTGNLIRQQHLSRTYPCRFHNTQRQRGRHQREVLLYATRGLTHCAVSWIRATYRRRFGIESSYCQLHQARIRTSSRKPALRLLFVGVSLILRNVWVWLHTEVIAQPNHGARQLRPQSMRFAPLLLWLLMEIARLYQLLRKILVYKTFARGLTRLESFSTTESRN